MVQSHLSAFLLSRKFGKKIIIVESKSWIYGNHLLLLLIFSHIELLNTRLRAENPHGKCLRVLRAQPGGAVST